MASSSARLLVCGSDRFDDQSFVYATLDAFSKNLHIGAIISGPFNGADLFAREWAIERNVHHHALDLGPHDMRLHSFLNTRPIPRSVLAQDELTMRGARRLQSLGVDLLLAIPRPSGTLGPAATNLMCMANVLDIPCFDGAEAFARARAALGATPQAPSAVRRARF